MIASGLPIDAVLPQVCSALQAGTSLLVTAEPGAGKSTVLPLALLDQTFVKGKKIIMLEPRVLAAKAAASRMASLLGEHTGQTVGFRTRLETQVSSATRIEVVTEAILTRMIQHDPALEDFSCVIFDEFHERSVHADLALALTLDARSAFRDDLRVIVMSATLDSAPVAALLDHAPVISAPGRCFEVRTIYSAEHEGLQLDVRIANAVSSALKAFPGDVLVFLPGEYEIHTAAARLSALKTDAEILPLYGNLSAAEQNHALSPHSEDLRRVILATSIAETSLTLPQVRIVIDSGLRRIPRFSPATGMDRLETVKVTKAGADQRRGRAGRTASGVCIRLWHDYEQNSLEDFAAPEILETDLAPLCLELIKWGIHENSVSTLRWLDPPPEVKVRQAFSVLRQLDAVKKDTLTPHGEKLLELPLHPRLAHAVFCGERTGFRQQASFLAALLAERDPLRSSSSRDIRTRLGLMDHTLPGADLRALDRIRKSAERIRSLAARMNEKKRPLPSLTPEKFPGIFLAAAYPERIARWHEPHSGEYTLANGVTGYIGKQDPLSQEEFLVAGETSTLRGKTNLCLAAPLDIELLRTVQPQLFSDATQAVWDDQRQAAVMEHTVSIGSVTLLRERQGGSASCPPEQAQPLLLAAIRKKGLSAFQLSAGASAWLNRVNFLHHWMPDDYPDLSPEALLASLEDWLLPYLGNRTKLSSLADLDLRQILEASLPPKSFSNLNRFAPERMEVPSGSHIRIDYSDPAQPKAAVRLQELFGLTSTPKLAGGRVPVLMDILSPAMRTVQITADLDSFWRESYFLVRKDMRGRYPKHDWPENPLQAVAHRGVRAPHKNEPQS